MVTFPNAKINLGLNVIRRRPDGYHDIATVMVPTAWRDILEIVPAPAGCTATTLTVTGRGVACAPEKNLVMKAYRAVEARYGSSVGPVEIHLHKAIPDGAGMGGGSADAAFTVMMLNDLFGLGMSDAEMAATAATVGADCPFFIYNRPMLCTGTGTDMTPFTLPAMPGGCLLAIVKPAAGVSTAQAYAGVTPQLAVPPVEEAAARPVEEWMQVLHNDFEPSVIAACPEIGRVKEQLLEMDPVYCAMSGSGSAVFALFAPADGDNLSAEELQRRLDERFGGCDVHVEPVDSWGAEASE